MTENDRNINTTKVYSKGRTDEMKVAKAILSIDEEGYHEKFQKTDV